MPRTLKCFLRKCYCSRAITGVFALAVVLASSSALPGQVASADPRDDQRRVAGRIDAAEGAVEETSAELAAAHKRLLAAEGKLRAARSVLGLAEKAVSEAKKKDEDLAQQLTLAEATAEKAQDDLAMTQRQTAETTDDVGGIARQAYQSGGIGALAVAFTASSADDFAQRVTSIDLALKFQGAVLAELGVQRAETSAQQARLLAVRRQVSLLKAQAAAQVLKANQVAAAAKKARNDVASLAAAQQKQVADIEKRKSSELKRLANLESEQRKITDQLQALAAAERAAAARRAAQRAADRSRNDSAPDNSANESSGYSGNSSAALSMPVPGARITSEFGQRYHPIWHTYRLHTGMDLGIACGTPVRAAASGSIISAGWNNAYGNRMMISHGQVRGSSLVTTYNHLTSISQSSGSVQRGQVIGYSGTTGWSTGCHLHFETYVDGSPQNPRGWL